MPKYRISLSGYADASITIRTDETDPERIFEQAMNEGMPSICAQCSGWGRDYSLEIGDDWEPETAADGSVVVHKEED